MISKSISISEKVNIRLPDIFDMVLYTWLIPHSDDFGRLYGSPAKIKALVVPMLDKSIKEVELSLQHIHDSELINWYEIDGDKYIQINNFEDYQTGLHKRTPSKFPSPNEMKVNIKKSASDYKYLTASESDIEELITNLLEQNKLLENESILSVDRQFRLNNSYLDIVAIGKNKYIFEIKRQRLSNSALEQVLKYRDMFDDPNVNTVLIGYGLAANFDFEKAEKEQVSILTYDDNLSINEILLFNVKCRQLTLISEGKGRELKGTEENRTEEEGNRRELDVDQQKNKILQLLNQNEVKDIIPYPLEQLESYVDVVDFEVIETAIKKSYRKHINYALKTLKGMIKDGIKTKEQLPKGGSQVETHSGRSDPSSQHTTADQSAQETKRDGRDAPRDEGNVVPIHGKSLTDTFARQG